MVIFLIVFCMFTRGYPRAHRRLGRTPRTCPTSNPSVVIPQVRPVSSLRKLHQVSLKLGWAYEGASFHPGKWDQESWSISGMGSVCCEGYQKPWFYPKNRALACMKLGPLICTPTDGPHLTIQHKLFPHENRLFFQPE